MSSDEPRVSLQADCERCVGLCCVAPAFSASADFAIDKAAGEACPNLQRNFRCSIHSRLKQEGFKGCVAYDCFGAGQHVTQDTFDGRDWRRSPPIAAQMFEVFVVMRQLHESLWYLTEALTLEPARPLHRELDHALRETERLTRGSPDDLVELDEVAHGRRVDDVLRRVSELARAAAPGFQIDHSGANLMGADMRGTDLRGANLRGAYLIGADLRGADLRTADVIGADVRDADVRGVDLSQTIFLTRSQIDAAKSDLDTRLPATLALPADRPPSALP